MIVQQHSVG